MNFFTINSDIVGIYNTLLMNLIYVYISYPSIQVTTIFENFDICLNKYYNVRKFV